MKKLTVTLLFSIMSIFCFAQTPFTEQTFLDFCNNMEKDPVQTLTKSAVPDYVFVGTGGWVADLKGLTGLYEYYTPVSFTPTEYKIRTYGNSAIATGRLKHTYTVKKTGAPRIVDELITYTYAWINGEWKLTSSQHSEAPMDKILDNPEEIVKKWIAEYNKDGKAFFENNCSDDFIASNSGIDGGRFFGREFIANRQRKENETNDVETTVVKSFKSGDLAIVLGILIRHHKQPDGSDKPDKTVSTFILQKKDGRWWYSGHILFPLKE